MRKLGVVFLMLGVVYGQEFRASLSGEVTDPAGAMIAGATVTVINLERNTRIAEVTSGLGRYFIQFLAPGGYRIVV